MKKTIIYIVCSFVLSSALAQQISLTDFYFLNSYYLNPAKAGDNGSNLFLQNRQQWKDIPGAPETSVLTLDSKINGRNVGLGLNLTIDTDNVFRKTNFGVSYAYYLKFSENHYLSMGLTLSVVNARIAYDQIEAADWSDPLLFTSNKSISSISADAGFNYRLKDLQVGIAGYQLPGTKMSFSSSQTNNSVSYQLVQHFWGVVSYNFHLLNEKLSITPEVQARTTIGLPLQIDAGANFDILNKMKARIAYRYNSSVYMAVAFNIYDNLTVGCAYDYSVGKIANFSGATYELVIGYKFGKIDKSETYSSDNRKLDKSIKRNIQEQSQELDRIEYENKKMQDEINANKQNITKLKEEIETLKKRAELSEDDIKMLNDIKLKYELSEDELNNRIENKTNNSSSNTQNTQNTNVDRNNENAESEEVYELDDDDNIDKVEEDSLSNNINSINGKYCVIVGAYRDINLAKRGQQILRREINLETTLIMEETGYFFFICSDFFNSADEVVNEKQRLNELNIENYIIGKPWTYFRKEK